MCLSSVCAAWFDGGGWLQQLLHMGIAATESCQEFALRSSAGFSSAKSALAASACWLLVAAARGTNDCPGGPGGPFPGLPLPIFSPLLCELHITVVEPCNQKMVCGCGMVASCTPCVGRGSASTGSVRCSGKPPKLKCIHAPTPQAGTTLCSHAGCPLTGAERSARWFD